MTTALPLLYQSGCLTIKDYDPESEMYTLSIPNREVRIGYVDGLMPAYIGLEGSDVQAGFALKFWRALKNGDIDQAMYDMKALKQIDDKGYAIPYQADGRRVVKVGVSVDADTRTIKDWNVAY
jgi:outer membrane protease